MLLAYQVGMYYKDLQDQRVTSALALVHQRFSTNTFPSWDLAHPFRMICHNGEINTLRGNVNWIRARQGAISSPVLGRDLDKLWPLIYDGQSDSASFDNALAAYKSFLGENRWEEIVKLRSEKMKLNKEKLGIQ